jgi:hypothetical protein
VSNPLLENNNACPRCGAPIFTVDGQVISACLCGKKHEQVPLMGSTQSQIVSNDIPIELLKEIIAVKCLTDKGVLNSYGVPVFAKTLQFLAQIGAVTITGRKGFNVEATWN